MLVSDSEIDFAFDPGEDGFGGRELVLHFRKSA